MFNTVLDKREVCKQEIVLQSEFNYVIDSRVLCNHLEMGCMDGWYGWVVWMGGMDGLYGWVVWMGG